MKPFLIVLIITLWTGCAQFDTDQKDISTTTTNLDGTTTTTRTITTKAKATTVAAGKQALANWEAAQTDGKQGASASGVSQESDAAPLAEAVARGAAAGAVSAMVPVK